jgi:hypothetical protein
MDLGSGHRASWLVSEGGRNLMTWHPNCSAKANSRWVDLVSGTHHRLISEDPLHIEPSLLCEFCGDHGFIRDGRWVPA